MNVKLIRGKNALFASVLVLLGGCAKKELEPTPPPVSRPAQTLRQPAELKPLDGPDGALREEQLFSEPVAAVGVRMDVRTVVVRPKENTIFPTPNEALLEVRSGALVTTINGEKKERTLGDMWLVEKGSKVELKVQGELAVLRTIYLVPMNKTD